MDMTDEQLIEKFFQEARQASLADNGFSDRVMQRIATLQTKDSRIWKLSRLWTAFCVSVAVILFVLLRGWELIAYALMMLVNTPPSQQQLLTLFVSVSIVGTMAVIELLQRQKYVF